MSKRLRTSRLHELHESKFPFASRIEFIRSKLSNFSAHVYGVIAAAALHPTPLSATRPPSVHHKQTRRAPLDWPNRTRRPTHPSTAGTNTAAQNRPTETVHTRSRYSGPTYTLHTPGIHPTYTRHTPDISGAKFRESLSQFQTDSKSLSCRFPNFCPRFGLSQVIPDIQY